MLKICSVSTVCVCACVHVRECTFLFVYSVKMPVLVDVCVNVMACIKPEGHIS